MKTDTENGLLVALWFCSFLPESQEVVRDHGGRGLLHTLEGHCNNVFVVEPLRVAHIEVAIAKRYPEHIAVNRLCTFEHKTSRINVQAI